MYIYASPLNDSHTAQISNYPISTSHCPINARNSYQNKVFLALIYSPREYMFFHISFPAAVQLRYTYFSYSIIIIFIIEYAASSVHANSML